MKAIIRANLYLSMLVTSSTVIAHDGPHHELNLYQQFAHGLVMQLTGVFSLFIMLSFIWLLAKMRNGYR